MIRAILVALIVTASVGMNAVFAKDLQSLKVDMLKGDYKAAISEGETLMANSRHAQEDDELYYLLAVCYLKEGNYLRASDIFDIIIKEFRNSRFREEALLGEGDTYYLRGDYQKAEEYYHRILRENSRARLKAQVYSRLSESGFKRGDTPQGKGYEEKLTQEFPLNIEAHASRDICSLLDFSKEPYYSVQVGCFSNKQNASNITAELKALGYDAFINESRSEGTTAYRVKVGKFKDRSDAALLQKKLTAQGYPTRLSP
jgi:tetratricopeptide (TPR) repeat protein